MASADLTPESLPFAVKQLFELNNYAVEGPIQMHGAEIDLVAKPKGDPFGRPVYIEVTVEYVDNDKYGKDVGKLAMVAHKMPQTTRLIVSSRGFSLPVKERAEASGIETLTYAELFSKFERFSDYVAFVREGGDVGSELQHLNDIYEIPDFEDGNGVQSAIDYLNHWRGAGHAKDRWLVVIGEYGTGKTALTKVLQYRWLGDYAQDASKPIPFRVELRDFTTQFDARGLLHHFLDTNGLGHLQIDFVLSLIKAGRVVLLLDGYDEMAQYLTPRERRSCLEALAELASGGARGILTSRPNYFTEAEELQVFEILYSSLKAGHYKLGPAEEEIVQREREIDQLLAKFLDQNQRRLKDLSREQTESLVDRSLVEDPKGRDAVKSILNRIFRQMESGGEISLSGKPVIVSYLLEVVEDLKLDFDNESNEAKAHLNEWTVYKLIVDKLMFRDYRRTPDMLPTIRRQFLRVLALRLSERDNPFADADFFKVLIRRVFDADVRRTPTEQRYEFIETRFTDLRSSATLTRTESGESGWKFSHNSLREFLAAEYLVECIENARIPDKVVPISDAMRTFVAARGRDAALTTLANLGHMWTEYRDQSTLGTLLSLVWDAGHRCYGSKADPSAEILKKVTGTPARLSGVELSRLSISSEKSPVSLVNADFSEAVLTDVDLRSADLRKTKFDGAYLDNVVLAASNLQGSTFRKAGWVDVDLAGAEISGSDFSGIDPSDIQISCGGHGSQSGVNFYSGLDALGYIKFSGGITDPLPSKKVWQHHSDFGVADKILRKLIENSQRQRRGLEQRGAAHQNIEFARQFLSYLIANKLLITLKNRKDLVEVTQKGRDMLAQYNGSDCLPDVIEEFMEMWVSS